MNKEKKTNSDSQFSHFSAEDLEKKVAKFLGASRGSKKAIKSHSEEVSVLLWIGRKLKSSRRLFRLMRLELKKIHIRFAFSRVFRNPFSSLRIKWKRAALLVILAAASISIAYFHQYIVRAATYTWSQNSWAGGASTAAPFPAHPANQSDWTKFYSKGGIDTTSGMTLERISN